MSIFFKSSAPLIIKHIQKIRQLVLNLQFFFHFQREAEFIWLGYIGVYTEKTIFQRKRTNFWDSAFDLDYLLNEVFFE